MKTYFVHIKRKHFLDEDFITLCILNFQAPLTTDCLEEIGRTLATPFCQDTSYFSYDIIVSDKENTHV